MGSVFLVEGLGFLGGWGEGGGLRVWSRGKRVKDLGCRPNICTTN